MTDAGKSPMKGKSIGEVTSPKKSPLGHSNEQLSVEILITTMYLFLIIMKIRALELRSGQRLN